MALNWGENNTDILLNHLKEREHIYNRKHPKYKTYNVITECAYLARMFHPPKNCKQVLDKITSIKIYLSKNKKLLDEGNSDIEDPEFFRKCLFMYNALFGNFEFEKDFKRKMETNNTLKERKCISKKLKYENSCCTNKYVADAEDLNLSFENERFIIESVEFSDEDESVTSKSDKYDSFKTLSSVESESTTNEVCLASSIASNNCNLVLTDTEEATNATKSDEQKIIDELEKKELLDVINLIRFRPFLWDIKHPGYGDNLFNSKVLEEIGNSLSPPLTVDLIKQKICYLRKRFFEEYKSKFPTWHLYKECKFFLKRNSNYSKPSRDKEKDANALAQFRNEINSCDDSSDDDENLEDYDDENDIEKAQLLRIVEFIRFRTFLWDKEHPAYQNIDFNRNILKTFGQTFDPPMSVNSIQYRILYLRQRFFTAVTENTNWHLKDNCNFFLKHENDANENVGYKNIAEVNTAGNLVDHNSDIYKFIQFIKYKPYFYDANHPKYNDIFFKTKILKNFGESLNRRLSEITLKKRIRYFKFRFFKSLRENNNQKWKWFKECAFFIGKDEKLMKNFLSIVQDDNNINKEVKNDVYNNNSTEENDICLEDTKDKNENSVREMGIQCNLYEELLEENMNNIQSKDCQCLRRTLDAIRSFNPLDKSLKLKSMKFNCFNDIQDSISDSSDYGLEEIPFPKKMQNSEKGDNNVYQCDKCSKITTSRRKLESHQRTFHFQHSLLCSKCGKIFSSYRKTQFHELRCKSDENLFCYQCNQLFQSKIIFNDHFNIVHDKKTPYVCCCSRSFTKYSKLVFHLNYFRCGTIDKCKLPDYVSKEYVESFLERENLKTFDEVDQKSKYWCRICKTNSCNTRSYITHFNREFHLKAEKNWLEEFDIEVPFQCEICDYNESIFNDIVSLVEHRLKKHRKHTLNDYFEKLEYISDEPIIITEPTDLRNIYSTCYICNKNFFMGDFEAHFSKKNHAKLAMKWLQKYNIKEIRCDPCLMKFKDLLEYLLHKSTEHNEVPTNYLLKEIVGEVNELIPENLIDPSNSKLIYKCSICNNFISYRTAYIVHMLRHYPERFIQCSCGEKFSVPADLNFHQRLSGCSKNGSIIPKFKVLGNLSVKFDSVV